MQARCPHCQSVFTTDRSGIQFCPNCGQQVDVPSAGTSAGTPRPPPSAGPGMGAGYGSALPPPDAGGDRRMDTPWERRRELGFFKGYFETWKEALFNPGEFFESVRPEGSSSDALLFGWLSQGVPLLLTLPLFFLVFGAAWASQVSAAANNGQLPADTARTLSQFSHLGPGLVVFLMVGILLFMPVYQVIQAALVHLGCLVTGSAQGGYSATLRAVSYAAAPMLLGFVPLVGSLAGLYAIVLQVIGVQKIQRTTTVKAILSVFWFLILCCCCSCIFWGAAMSKASSH